MPMNSVGDVAGRRHQTRSLSGPAPRVPSNASTHAFGFSWYGACGERRCDSVPPRPSSGDRAETDLVAVEIAIRRDWFTRMGSQWA
jgi:hypothetical protein